MGFAVGADEMLLAAAAEGDRQSCMAVMLHMLSNV